MAQTSHVLVVDDDQEIRRLLGRYLSEQGFRVSLAGSKREFNERLATEKFDIVILDVLLPDGSGLDLCRQLRQKEPQLPVILVTALKEDVDRIIGLEIGADDYIGKPFNPRELLARMRAVLRRSAVTPPVTPAVRTVFHFAGFVADAATRSVVDGAGTAIELTGAEFELLRAFLDRPGRILSREQLLDLTQGREAGPFDRSIDVLVSRLRKKFGQASGETLFKTVRNGGYQLAAHVERKDPA
ncbi:MAG: response regulator [Devosia sp.]|nr:response regulator [Devosia sp.]